MMLVYFLSIPRLLVVVDTSGNEKEGYTMRYLRST